MYVVHIAYASVRPAGHSVYQACIVVFYHFIYDFHRICLNNQPIFQYGPLDQGWWPDGLLTPPSEEAMLWDIINPRESA